MRNEKRKEVCNFCRKKTKFSIQISSRTVDTPTKQSMHTYEIIHVTKALSGSNTPFGSKKPTMRKNGEMIQTQEELATLFREFLQKKIAKTEMEEMRAELETLPEQDGVGDLTREEAV